ncbi:hypothetical protein ACK3TF_004714 [Chlorella vulgaris]
MFARPPLAAAKCGVGRQVAGAACGTGSGAGPFAGLWASRQDSHSSHWTWSGSEARRQARGGIPPCMAHVVSIRLRGFKSVGGEWQEGPQWQRGSQVLERPGPGWTAAPRWCTKHAFLAPVLADSAETRKSWRHWWCQPSGQQEAAGRAERLKALARLQVTASQA